MSDKLFIVTRADLPPGARAAQSVHAALAFAHEHPDVCGSWYRGSNNIVVLEAPDEDALIMLMHATENAPGVTCSAFKEPDFDDEVTAIAVSHAAHRLVSHLPLALKEPKRAA
jgi:hypothetical protein